MQGDYFGEPITGMIDTVGGRMHFWVRDNPEPGKGLYLLAVYECGVMTGFEEVSRVRFLESALADNRVSLAGADVFHWSANCPTIPEEDRQYYFANLGALYNPDIPPCPVCIPIER